MNDPIDDREGFAAFLLRLRGRGMPGATPGDQYVTVEIHAPPAHTDAQRKLYEQMAKAFA